MRTIGSNRIKYYLRSISFFIGIISMLASLVLCMKTDSNFNFVFIWPICLCLFFVFCYNPFSYCKPEHELGLGLVVYIELIPRYAVYPILLLLMPSTYTGVSHISYDANSVHQGVIFGTLELIGLTVFVFFFERISLNKKSRNINEKQLYLSGNKWVYIVYIIFSIAIYVMIGRKYNIIQFLSMKSGYSEISSNIYITLVKYIVSIALSIATLMVLDGQRKKYINDSGSVHIIVSVITSIVYTGFIVGESRSTQVAIGVLMCLILIHDYPKHRLNILIWMSISVVFVVLSITIFRTGDTNLMGNGIQGLTDKLQVYFGGPTSISQSVTILSGNSDINISKLIFDNVRSCFPFNLFFKGNGYTTSQIYNLLLYNGQFTHGHIVFGASYGFLYFGYLGIPLNICLNYFLISKANEIYFNTSSYEVKYVSGYCLIRLVNAFLVNTPTILGSVTQYIGTFGLLILVSNILKKGNKGIEDKVDVEVMYD